MIDIKKLEKKFDTEFTKVNDYLWSDNYLFISTDKETTQTYIEFVKQLNLLYTLKKESFFSYVKEHGHHPFIAYIADNIKKFGLIDIEVVEETDDYIAYTDDTIMKQILENETKDNS